jgi:transcriptional regulator with XRE-family HTH domain
VAYSARRLTELREKRGLSKSRLADLAKISRTYLGQLEAAEYVPSVEVAERLAAVLDVTLPQFLGLEAPVAASDPHDLLMRAAALLPEEIPELDLPISGVASASPNTGLSNDDIILSEPRALAGRLRRYRIAGDCMEPDIPDGAVVLVNVARQPQLGEPVLVQIGDAVLCKVVTGRNGAWVLRCTHGDQREVRLRPGDEMTYIGVVERVITRPRRYSATNTRR